MRMGPSRQRGPLKRWIWTNFPGTGLFSTKAIISRELAIFLTERIYESFRVKSQLQFECKNRIQLRSSKVF